MSVDRTPTIDVVGKLVGMVATVSIGLSLVYDWGFYHTLGLSLTSVPAALADHAKSALDWAPVVTLTTFIYIAYEVLSRRIEKGKTEEAIVAASPNPSRTRKIRNSAPKALTIMSALGLLMYVALGEVGGNAPYILIGMLWAGIVSSSLSQPGLSGWLPTGARWAVTTAPFFMSLFWDLGHSNALKLYNAPPATVLTTTASKTTVKIAVLRYLDKGILFRDASGRISYLQWSAVDRLDTDATYRPWRGLMCKGFDIGCHFTDQATQMSSPR